MMMRSLLAPTSSPQAAYNNDMKKLTVFLLFVLLAIAAVKETRPNGKRYFPKRHPETQANRNKPNRDTMAYHGGPIMLGTTNVYYIWYGNWSGSPAISVLTDFASNIGGSPWYNINTTYANGAGVKVTNSVKYVSSTADTYSYGGALSDLQIQAVVSRALTTGKLPKDPNAVYFVLTSQDVTAASGFCTQYCGWHDHTSIGGVDIKYSFVGNPERCPDSCAAQLVGPNGISGGADGMASIIAHELVEAVTDPDLNAWYDSRGYENADKCAWTYGNTYTVSNGAFANVKLGTRDFLIQRNWLNGSGICVMNY